MKTTTKPVCRRVHCDSCEALVINGVICHERGCPDAWRDHTRECKRCGHQFKPESRRQDCCDDDCVSAYYGP